MYWLVIWSWHTALSFSSAVGGNTTRTKSYHSSINFILIDLQDATQSILALIKLILSIIFMQLLLSTSNDKDLLCLLTDVEDMQQNMRVPYFWAGADVVQVRRQSDRQNRLMSFFTSIVHSGCKHQLLSLADSQHICTSFWIAAEHTNTVCGTKNLRNMISKFKCCNNNHVI